MRRLVTITCLRGETRGLSGTKAFRQSPSGERREHKPPPPRYTSLNKFTRFFFYHTNYSEFYSTAYYLNESNKPAHRVNLFHAML